MVSETKISRVTQPGWRPDMWPMIGAFIGAIVLIPICAVLWIAIGDDQGAWAHLTATTLPRYVSNSLIMMVSVGVFSIALGVTAAWLIVLYRFPGHLVLQYALFLPLAVPAYIGAYAFVDFWEYAGPMQTGLRAQFGWASAADYWFPEIRSRGAGIFVLTMSLYPYVYLLARSALREQPASVFETARALGAGRFALFGHLGIRLIRPAIIVGVSLVMMEVLNDFGTMDYFAVQTLTTGIFTVWLEASNVTAAAQIAAAMIFVLLILLVLERSSRRHLRSHQSARQLRPLQPIALRGLVGVMAGLFCLLPIVFGFIMPVAILAGHAFGSGVAIDAVLGRPLWNSVFVSGATAVLCVIGAIALAVSLRLTRSRWIRVLVPVATIGFAIPGAVLALGVLVPLARLDHILGDWLETLGFSVPGLLITGSAAGVIIACSIRFFALAFGGIDGAFGRISPSLINAGRSLGKTRGQVLTRVELPLMPTTLLTAVLMVFIDTIKELPATLMLRPFGFDTLATSVYQHASLEDIARAAPGALVIIFLGLIAVSLVATANR